MRLLLGREPVLRKDVDLKTEHWCGWDIVKQLLHEGDVLYSFGVADDIGFERKACEAGVCVFPFDPTPYSVNWIAETNLPPSDQFRAYPWAAAERDGKLTLYPRISKKVTALR